MRDSLPDALRAPVAAWKILAWATPVLLALGTWSLTRASHADVDTAIAVHNATPRDKDGDTTSPHQALVKPIAALEIRAGDTERRLSAVIAFQAEQGRWAARMMAADVEPDHRRRAQAADHAESVFDQVLDQQRRDPTRGDRDVDVAAAVKAARLSVPSWRGVRGGR